jgi:WD40 repeat protein
VVTAAWDHTARIWNAATGQAVTTLAGHTDAVVAAAFSPDGTRVVTWGMPARIWNAATGQVVTTLTGHTDDIRAGAFSPDGTRVVTASTDQTARIWPIGGEYLQSRVRAQTRVCLEAEFRQATLGESPLEAAGHEKACKICVPRFFARLKGVPSGESQIHIAAWREYRECLATLK